MIGYALFLVPMATAFWAIARRHGARQAFLDLIAFNLLFAFDFTSLLPGETNLQLLHVLLLAYLSYEAARMLQYRRMAVRLRLLIVIIAAMALVGWVGLASLENRLDDWGPVRVINYVVRIYLFSALFLFVGAAIAHRDRLRRFLLIFCLGGMVVGAISLVQTLSMGTMLTSDTSPRYLGIFQPEGPQSFQTRMEYLIATDFINQVRKVTVGNFTFYRATGTFNGATVNLCIGALVALCLLTSREPAPRWLLPAFVLMLAGVAVAFVRTFLGTLVLLTAFVLLVRFHTVFLSRRILSWLIPLIGLSLIGALTLPPVQAAIFVIYDSYFGEKAGRELMSLNGRVALWSVVLEQIGHNPLFGTNRPITMLEVSWGTNASPEFGLSTHNSFLEVAYNAGLLPAFLLASLFGFSLYRSARLMLDRSTPPGEHSLFLALFVAIVAMFIVNQTGDWMNAGPVAALFWAICGCLATYATTPAPIPPAPVPARSPLVGAGRL